MILELDWPLRADWTPEELKMRSSAAAIKIIAF